jgi:Mrp family chromosome partitioning ATPase/predicted Fe-Mo cluster-binding NifX family protein
MSEECAHNCESCGEDCDERTRESFLEKPHDGSCVEKVIGVVSGKGGVGKSLVTSLLAVLAQREGYQAAILDADITGPSIPTAFGLHTRAEGTELGLYPVESKTGIRIMSLNLLVEHETDPVVWRGPIIAGAVKQFWTDVIWGDVDYMFIDMPPGTGDVPLTVFQSIPVDGLVIVASPQELVGMIVEKAVNMAGMMNIPVLALVENMSYVVCPDCGKEIRAFGESHVESIAQKHGIKNTAKIPIDPKLSAACDAGMIELFEGNWLDELFQTITKQRRNDIMKIAVACNGKEIFGHFGHCENFTIFETENGKIVSESSVPNPGHKPGFLPNFLGDMGVEVIIAGGMGGGAVDIFNERNIEVIVGAEGDARTAVTSYLKGELKSTGSVCHDHAYESECGGHK